VSGLGGNPYRDGSFAYYMSEPVIVNDPKGIGAFINAANEMELLPKPTGGATVLLDYFFNNERKKEPDGRMVRWHYTWEDRSNGGFQFLGSIYTRMGARLRTLEASPTAAGLKGASVYIIVDADTEKETEKPNAITESASAIIANWVKGGGTLVLLANDAGNNDLQGMNRLAGRFGILFNNDNFNQVEGSRFEQGAVDVPTGHTVFPTAKKLYIKELATLEVRPPATAVLKKEGRNIMAVATYGKGRVFILGDPWLYNEYVDGRKLPADFDNFKAAEDLVRWTLQQKRTK
jgi:unsaturated rhamnogalacturonyl hydrolase